MPFKIKIQQTHLETGLSLAALQMIKRTAELLGNDDEEDTAALMMALDLSLLYDDVKASATFFELQQQQQAQHVRMQDQEKQQKQQQQKQQEQLTQREQLHKYQQQDSQQEQQQQQKQQEPQQEEQQPMDIEPSMTSAADQSHVDLTIVSRSSPGCLTGLVSIVLHAFGIGGLSAAAVTAAASPVTPTPTPTPAAAVPASAAAAIASGAGSIDVKELFVAEMRPLQFAERPILAGHFFRCAWACPEVLVLLCSFSILSLSDICQSHVVECCD